MTGIPNRRRFDDKLEDEWLRAKHNGKPLSVLLADIDYFKQFNDRYGHIAGDHCLKRVAESLDGVAQRPHDLVARFGGEEFGCVLPECNTEGALDIAGRCLKKMADLGIQHADSDAAPHVTISIGAVTAMPHEGSGPVGLLKRVDELLYRAKDEGRNRFIHESLG